MASSQLIRTQRLQEFFWDEVRRATAHQKVQILPETEFYLVELLSAFSLPQRILSVLESEQPLATTYLESLHQEEAQQYQELKQLADFSLYMSGFFQENITRKLVDLSYYINLGGKAYLKLSDLPPGPKLRHRLGLTFSELGHRFVAVVDLLAEISENFRSQKDSDLLKLYQRWLTTGSERCRCLLQKKGIHPLRTSEDGIPIR